MKKIIFGLALLSSISAFATETKPAEIKTAPENIIRLNVTAVGADGRDRCNDEVKSLAAKLEKANKVVLKTSSNCSELYRYEYDYGVVARYNGFVEYLKY